MVERGFLVCADLSGYTGYLNESELDHAAGVLSDLLDVVLGQVRAPLRLSRLEGDAVISYAVELDGQSPQILVDRLENTYVAFRRALDQIVLNTTCQCSACANLNLLDLKFVVHHGEFVVQHKGGHEELMGSEVNLLFRLTKNSIQAALGTRGYLALTLAASDALGLPEYTASLVDHEEQDTEVGTVLLKVKDMVPVWERRRSEGVVDFAAEGVWFALERRFPVPAGTAWDYLTRPDTRAIMFESKSDEVKLPPGGAMGADGVYVCWHGNRRDDHVVVDWDPPRRYAYSAPLGFGLAGIGEFRVAPDGEHSIVSSRFTTPRARHPFARVLGTLFRRPTIRFMEGALDRILERIEADRA